MNNHSTSRAPVTACKSVALLVSAVMATAALGAATELATEPFSLTSTSTIKALPNIMFVLDDSGSMRSDFLPDWAGPYQQMIGGVLTTVTPAHRFFNSAFNGIAYNPATRYRPPVMYTVSGSLDTTTYPSQDGQSTASGGDASATAALPNWRAVKVDGYGVQSTANVSLEGAAFFYTTIPGEYCDAVNLRSCTAASAAAGSYTYAAPLRWCTTSVKAAGTTVDAGTACQASNIEPAAGITDYTHPRIARPRTSAIQFTAGGTVTSITVGGVEILSASATGLSNPSLATDVAAKVNACTMGVAGGCGTLGYMAVVGGVASDTVTLIAPGATTATPVVTGGSTGSISAFSGGNAPGATLFTVITPTVTSYPYPGSTTKASGRIDCAGTTCTYAEEMTNYANWYTYYRTRMQMMKTSSSIAFSNVDDKFRVGYFSINNGSGSDFLDVGAFDGSQRNAWYSKFFAAVPFGTTPLRTGLATAGRYYAGLLSTINGQAVDDPMQYSCQQNYTILSTDGYWNDASNPVGLDGSTPVGNQDGSDLRPYYDGSTQTRTVMQTLREDIQTGMKVKLVEQMTQQIQRTTTPINKSVDTTFVYDFEQQASPLQTRTRQLDQTQYNLRKVTQPLIQTPLIYTELTVRYDKTAQRLNSNLNKLRETKTLAWQRTQGVRIVTAALKKTTTRITITETPLIRSVHKLTKTTRKLQKRWNLSFDGGDDGYPSWSAWSDVSSCTAGVLSPTQTLTPGTTSNRVECQYVIVTSEADQDSCTRVDEPAGPNYTVQNTVQCEYQSPTTEPVTGTHTDYTNKVTSGNNLVKAITYAYGTAQTPQTGQTACSLQGNLTPGTTNGTSYTGPYRTCEWDASPYAPETGNVTSGTCVVNNPGNKSSTRVLCAYDGTSDTQNDKDECTVKTGNTGTTTGNTYSILSTVTCSRGETTAIGSASWADVPDDGSTCTYAMTGASANNPGASNNTVWKRRVECGHKTSSVSPATNDLASCTVKTGLSGSAGTDGTVYTTKTACSYAGGTPSSGTNLGTCTQGTADSGTANNSVWNEYTSCTWATLLPADTTGPHNSCVPSGGQSGSTFTGPRVTCANRTATAVPNPTSCTPSVPNPPVPLYSSPIVTCEYVADTANATTVTSCTPSATIACAYGTATTLNNQSQCKPQSQTLVAGVYYGPSVDCTWITGSTTTQNNCTETSQAVDGTGNYNGPAYTCAYRDWSGWNPSGGSCVWRNEDASPGPYQAARQCQYGNSVDTRVGVCTPVPGSSGTTNGDSWNVVQRVVCSPGPHTEGPTTVNTPNAGICVQGTSVTNPTPGVEETVVTSCTWGAASTVDTGVCNCSSGGSVTASPPTCTAAGGESPAGTFNTLQVCSITNQDPTPANGVDDRTWVAVAPSCTSTAGLFDGNGQLVDCRETDKTTGYSVAYPAPNPVPVASCTPGTDNATKYQTTCTTVMPKTKTPEPVATCTATVPSEPDYVVVNCIPNNSATTVMGCVASSPTAPHYQTITCVDNGDGTSNTLADVAAYYYKADLRTPALNNCIGAVVPPATSGSVLCSVSDAMNNVPTTATDTNSAQHMTTFTLGLGASGYMRYSSTYNSDTSGDFHSVKGVSPYLPANGIAANPSSGVCAWQSSGLCNWPFPDSDEQTTIDDLWHAGVNGRGAYFSATDPVSLANSISSTLAQVASQSGAASAAALSNPVLSPGDSYVFAGIYKSVDWTGDVVRITLDPISGMPGNSYDWSVQGKLDAKAFSSRNIWTFDAAVATTKLKAFNSANFAANSYFIAPHINTLTQYQCIFPDICLSATDQDNAHASGANLVNYLRGERTHEGAETDNTKYYRQRANVLGDIVNAQIVYVNTPYGNYADPGYGAFKTAQASRQAVAYAAANDGMLHAFAAKGAAATEALVLAAANDYAAAVLDPANAAKATAAAASSAAATAALAADTVVAQEMWAYIPSMVLPQLHRLADKKYRDKHRYYVDTTPAFGDICISNCTNAATAVWKTILVGGLGRGGRGYYALDITDPANPKALWEFTNANLGYTYGMPQIVKRKCGATDTTCQSAPWVVLLSSGYNNIPNDDGTGGDGVGRLFVLNAETGAQISGISPLSTGAGDVTTPSGLTKITAAVANPSTDATVIGIYGGDLLGNLWRFDINDDVGAAGYEAQLFAVLKDGSGKRQPITTTPLVSLVRGKYIVMLGTGQLLASSDSSVTDPQTLYGLVDRRATGTTATTAIYDNPGGSPRPTVAGVNANGFVMQMHSSVSCPSGAPTYLCTSGEMVMTSTTESVDYAVDNGWFVDLINTSERANLDPDLALGTLVFNTNAPSLSACDLGGKSYQYWLDYRTGGALVVPGAYNIVGVLLSNSLASAPKLISTPQGLRVVSQTGGGGGPPGTPTVTITPEQARLNNMRRSSWRELIAE